MTKLYLHNKEVENLFDLLGDKENDITFSLSFSLSRVKPFLNKLIKELTDKKIDLEEIDIMLQEYEDDKGYTDIELISEDIFCIIEAKKGWNLPSKEQLEKYAHKLKEYKNLQPKLVVVSECKKFYADEKFKKYGIKIPIEFVSWQTIHKWVKEIGPQCNNYQKNLLEELDKYFKKVITMQDKDSNEVFCVVVSNKNLMNGFTFLDVIRKGYYFYPMEGGWPKVPPTYLAVRHKAKLMSIHYVEGYDIVEKPDDHIPELKGWKDWRNCLHYILKLGKPFKPNHEVKNGKIYPNQHIKFMLDTPFICKTIKEARDLTNERKNN